MKRVLLTIVLILCLHMFVAADLIEKIVIEGNLKVGEETILFYIKSKEKSVFSENMLQSDFKALYKTGFFESIRIESENGNSGKIVKIQVVEYPQISSVEYKTGRKIKEDDIVKKLLESNISIIPFSHFNPAKLNKIKRIIMELLQEKGYNDGKVNFVQQEKNGSIELTIDVVQGPRTRIGNIVFPGLDYKKISHSFLMKGFKENKQHGLLSMVTGKDVYNKETIADDLSELKLRLEEKGYLEAKMGKPEFSMSSKSSILGKVQQMLNVTIPIELGPQYRVGEINIEGNEIIKKEFLKLLVKLEKGKIYNKKKITDAVDEIQKFYGNIGHFYVQVTPLENLDPIKQIANLTINVAENDVVYLGKLEFVGNSFTKDHVLRREWFLREGLRMSREALESSIKRMKQLGLVNVEKMPDMEPDQADPQRLNMKVHVTELNRQMINFNVGYSGYDGWFIALGYQTQNFLGMGESLTLNLQSGTRSKNYRFGFTEPWLFNLPANAGFDVFKTAFQYPNLYTREGEGFNVHSSIRFWRFWGASLMYSLERVNVKDVNDAIQFNNPYSYYYFMEGKRTISSLVPTLYYSTVDSPIFPTSGTKYLINYQYSGGFFGGDINLDKYKFEFVKFFRGFKRHTVGLHAVYKFINPRGNSEIPFYERYFLGGERSIRGYEIYQIGNTDELGNIVGGDKALFFNFEYQIPISNELSFNFFYDIGNTFVLGQKVSLSGAYSSAGAEIKLYMPMLSVPFRLIFAYNSHILRGRETHFAFRFAIGPSFY